MNSEVFYLSGVMHASDVCMQRAVDHLRAIPSISGDSLLVLSGQAKVDSCISKRVASSGLHCLMNVFPICPGMLLILWWPIWINCSKT